VFIGNIDAAGYGITLTAASNVVFVEASWTPKDLMQCIDRCHRIGQTSSVIGHILTIHKSIDAQVLHSVLRKLDISQSVIKETDMSNEFKVGFMAAFEAFADKLEEVEARVAVLEEQLNTAVKETKEVAKTKPAPNAKAKPEVTAEAAEEKIIEIELYEPEAEEEVAEKPNAQKASIDDVREAFAKVLAAGHGAFAKEILVSYGAKKVSDLPEAKYAAVVADIKSKLGA
jgi:hypothetical protein